MIPGESILQSDLYEFRGGQVKEYIQRWPGSTWDEKCGNSEVVLDNESSKTDRKLHDFACLDFY